MALEVGSRGEQSAKVQVLVSELHELNFALFLATCEEGKPGHKPPEWITNLRRDNPDLCERVRTFWDNPGYYAWDEMFIAAHQMGTLLDERNDRFFDWLPRTLERSMTVPPLPTETPNVPVIVAERLEKLRESPELRERYVALLKEFWHEVGPLWEATGRAGALEAARALRAQPTNLEELRKVLAGCTMLRREEYEEIVRASLERSEVVVVPLWLAGDGQSLLALPGTLLVGVGLEAGRKIERKREQAERAAARLKVLSDPTRVSILMQLMHTPNTITDLANYFDLSQPTVSVHMKVLREAGLVTAEKAGNQTKYRADADDVWKHVAAALREIGVEPPV